jgi:hypothetical protein
MYSADRIHGIQSPAENKVDAYEKAVYTLIPEKEGGIPYSAWVHSVTYNNGNYREFNTFEGNPY